MKLAIALLMLSFFALVGCAGKPDPVSGEWIKQVDPDPPGFRSPYANWEYYVDGQLMGLALGSYAGWLPVQCPLTEHFGKDSSIVKSLEEAETIVEKSCATNPPERRPFVPHSVDGPLALSGTLLSP